MNNDPASTPQVVIPSWAQAAVTDYLQKGLTALWALLGGYGFTLPADDQNKVLAFVASGVLFLISMALTAVLARLRTSKYWTLLNMAPGSPVAVKKLGSAPTVAGMALFILPLLVLGACTTSSQITVGRTLAAAQDAVASASNAAVALYQAGSLPGGSTTLKSIDALVDQADNASMTARCAYAAGDNVTVASVMAELAQVTTAIGQYKAGSTPGQILAVAAQTCTAPAPAAAVVAK